MAIPNLRLNDGNLIPAVGLGLWKVSDYTAFNTAFAAAVAAGYRHFDTAQVYGNEAWLGQAVQSSELKRQDFWITTKLSAHGMMTGKSKQHTEQSLAYLKTDYIDLLLIHFPVPVARRFGWKVLEGLQAEGKIRAIGVSNYDIHHLEHMRRYAKLVPAVNQIEMHVFLQRPELLRYCHEKGIIVEAYSPLAHAVDTTNTVVADLARKHHKSYAQIMLRWCIEQGVGILPKSVTPLRIQENIDIFDFTFDGDDLKRLKKIDRHLFTCRPTAAARFVP